MEISKFEKKRKTYTVITIIHMKSFLLLLFLISTLKKRKNGKLLYYFLMNCLFFMLEVSEAPGDKSCTIHSNQITEII